MAHALQEALPAPWVEGRLITDTTSAVCMETDDGHDVLMQVACLDLTVVGVPGTFF